MYGAALGDIIGAPYESGGKLAKTFPLFRAEPWFTDDTIMTVAVAQALLKTADSKDADKIRNSVVKYMRKWGLKYDYADYGGGFNNWLHSENAGPYYSYGNGSAMRCSAAGWLAKNIEEAEELAKLTAEVTHDHPEGIKGAQATATAIFLARNKNKSVDERKREIKEFLNGRYGYDTERGYGTLGMTDVTCQKTVPYAVISLLESESFEDCVRMAVALGGDTDTAAAIAGSIAEALYGIPSELTERAKSVLPKKMVKILDKIKTDA